MAQTLNDNIDKNKITKRVRVAFVGSDDVIQHIVPLKEKKLVTKSIVKPVEPKKDKRVSYAKTLDDDGEDEEDEDEEESNDESSDVNMQFEESKPSKALSVRGDDILGCDLFSFRTPKKSKQLLAKAAESLTPSSKNASSRTPAKRLQSDSTCATPTSTTKTPKSILKKTPVSKLKAEEAATPLSTERRSKRVAATTPHRLWKRNEENQSESSDSCESTDEEAENEDADSFASPSSSSKSIKSKIPSATPGKGKPSTPVSSKKQEPQKRKRKLFEENHVTAEHVESYFHAQSATVHTSDRTLSRLETPSMSPLEMVEALKKTKFKYENERKGVVSGYHSLFNKWMYLLCQGYNLLLHGFGSKYNVLDEFRKTVLKDFTHVVVNGYFPSLSIKSILNSITDDVCQHSGGFSNVVDQYEFIRKYFEIGEQQDFFLVIHNIDGAMLRSEKSQVVLSLLAQIRGFHVVASIDHINAPLLWDQTKISRFRWLWQDVTTFENYTNETSYENSLFVQQTGGLALSSLIHVMRSLNTNARGIFLLLAKHQLDNQDNSSYQGLPFADFYQRCREAFLVNSELTLQTQLTEFKDHKLIRTKKGADGVDYLVIALDSSTLTQYLEGEKE